MGRRQVSAALSTDDRLVTGGGGEGVRATPHLRPPVGCPIQTSGGSRKPDVWAPERGLADRFVVITSVS